MEEVKQTAKPEERITVRNVPVPMKKAIENIAENEGMTISTFLKQHFRAIVNSYPENMKQKQE